ncbi:MAG: NAD(P)/FAD-dependent oxidoreductase [Firmicutes bacterium]|nr:NAD(P)/FAD-dependent oxidoreductase [Bacillota bacterium]
MPDVIVVGGGVSGLSAACSLAHSGADVLVLEQHAVVGGYCSMFKRGHTWFDAAVHVIGGLGPHEVLTELLSMVELDLDWIPVEPLFATYMHGQLYDAWDHTLSETLREGLVASKRTSHKVSFEQWLNQQSNLQTRRILLESSSTLYTGMPSSEISALGALLMFDSYYHGGFYPRGGSRQLPESLKAYLIRQGSTVKTRTQVTTLSFDDDSGTWTVSTTKGDFSGRHVIWAATPNRLQQLLPLQLPSLEPGPTAHILYVEAGPDLKIDPIPESMLWSTDPSVDPANHLLEFPEVRAVLSIPTLGDPSLCPSGHHVLSFAVPSDMTLGRLPNKKAYAESIISAVERGTGWRVKDAVIRWELAQPSTLVRYTGNWNGALYGWRRFLPYQGMPTRLPYPNLIGCSHWGRYGHGIYGVTLAGVRAAEAVRQRQQPPHVKVREAL